MEFHFKDGCLPKEEWIILNTARQCLQDSFYPVITGGFKENETDYYPVDFLSEPEEIKRAISIFYDCFK